MIYTIGRTSAYEQSFIENPEVYKLGRTVIDGKFYPGGSVWKTIRDAQSHCPEGFSVYGVMADWDKDTEGNEENSWNDLLVDSRLCRLV